MKLNRLLPFLSFILVASILSAFVIADGDPIPKIAAQLEKWTDSYPVEKVYLHLDKPYYAIGDDIWFKAYVTIGAKHELSDLSKVLNVELVDEQDSVRKLIKLPVNSGLALGDFMLDDSVKEGNYRVRAYTNYMRNAGPDYFFDKTIRIVNPATDVATTASYVYADQNGQQKVTASIKYTTVNGLVYAGKAVSYEIKTGLKTSTKGRAVTDGNGDITISFINANAAGHGFISTVIKVTDKKTVNKTIAIKAFNSKVNVQFFPESGYLVSGISSTVAFKAVGADGLGAMVNGVVTDNENHEVAQFTSQHAGMGTFNMRPQSGHQYKARVTYTDGTQNDVNLPQVIDKGYVLSVHEPDSSKIVVRVTTSRAIMETDSTSVVSLVAQAGGKVCYAAKSKPGTGTFQASIPKNKFPTGIVQFTLFSSAGDALNERLVFIQNNDQLNIKLSGVKSVYTTREHVNIDFDARDKNNKVNTGSFSVAVTDESKMPVDEDDENTIFSNLLLTSDLKGYVEKPNYYFTNVNDKKRAELDLLMMTQGYRRFEWKQLMSDDFKPIVFQPEKALEISGHVKTTGGKPVPHGKVTLFSSSGGLLVVDTTTDENGRFVFNNLVFKDSVKFMVQARTNKGSKDVDIDLENIPSKFVTANKNSADVKINLSDNLSAYLINSKAFYDEQVQHGFGNHGIQLKDVVIKAVKEPLLKHSDNLNGPGNADQIIKGNDILLQGCAFIADCLQGRLIGVMFKNGVAYSNRSPGRPMQIVVDGSFVGTDFLNNISADNIASIEVLKGIQYTSVYGAQGGAGILLITTKRFSDEDVYTRYAPGVINYKPKGYFRHRVFYSPQYDDPKTNSTLPDLRSTIYWKPDILSDKTGSASFSYFNADGKGTYRVVIEGIDTEGNLGRLVYCYKVE